MLFVDAHLDLAYNALRGRDVLSHARLQKPDPDDIPTCGLPDLRDGRIGLICATIYCEPCLDPTAGTPKGYRTCDEAYEAGWAQLSWYRKQHDAGVMRLITSAAQLEVISPPDQRTSAILLLEGADPIRTPEEAADWHAAGVRIVGMAWKRTRYAGGTGMPGPLSPEGIALVAALDALGMIHDASHLAEESFWQLLEISTGPVIASHSNCRAIVPTDRQLSDAMIQAIAARGGVIGINFYDRFLLPPADFGKRRATLADVVAHIHHICQRTGSATHVGIGADLDGGLGRDQIPVEIQTAADVPKLADALTSAGFPDADIRGICGENWLNFFRQALPDS